MELVLLITTAVCILISIISLGIAISAKSKVKGIDIQTEIEGAEDRISKLIDRVASENPDSLKEISTLNRAITGIGIEKYDAFPGITGAYSFSVALVNEKSDGIIITTLYGHDSCNTYLREIKNGMSDAQLSPEELNALKKANNK